MKIYHHLRDKQIPSRPRSIAIGIFDGIHRGHQKILAQLLRDAKRLHLTPMVITFEPHPNKILKSGSCQPSLMSLNHRLRFFEKMGVKETLVISFDKKFSKISHEYFLETWLCEKLDMKSLSVGEDFRFGFQGLGNAQFLFQKAERSGFKLNLVPALKQRGQIISSTLIRKLIETGDLKKAARMLGRPVCAYGIVVHGRRRGHRIGFPTANLNLHHETLPPSGVYAAWGVCGRKKMKGVVHIGPKPTFNDKQKSIEVHFFNFHKGLYDRNVELHFMERLRSIKKFKDSAALVRAIKNDSRKALNIL